MPTLNELPEIEKAHWALHLNAALNDSLTTLINKDIATLLRGRTTLPKIAHPAYIHDWLEFPEKRIDIEALNG